MAMYANGNESPTLRTYVSDETKVSFLNVSTFKSAQVPWTYFFKIDLLVLVLETAKLITYGMENTYPLILEEHLSLRISLICVSVYQAARGLLPISQKMSGTMVLW